MWSGRTPFDSLHLLLDTVFIKMLSSVVCTPFSPLSASGLFVTPFSTCFHHYHFCLLSILSWKYSCISIPHSVCSLFLSRLLKWPPNWTTHLLVCPLSNSLSEFCQIKCPNAQLLWFSLLSILCLPLLSTHQVHSSVGLLYCSPKSWLNTSS